MAHATSRAYAIIARGRRRLPAVPPRIGPIQLAAATPFAIIHSAPSVMGVLSLPLSLSRLFSVFPSHFGRSVTPFPSCACPRRSAIRSISRILRAYTQPDAHMLAKYKAPLRGEDESAGRSFSRGYRYTRVVSAACQLGTVIGHSSERARARSCDWHDIMRRHSRDGPRDFSLVSRFGISFSLPRTGRELRARLRDSRKFRNRRLAARPYADFD